MEVVNASGRQSSATHEVGQSSLVHAFPPSKLPVLAVLSILSYMICMGLELRQMSHGCDTTVSIALKKHVDAFEA